MLARNDAAPADLQVGQLSARIWSYSRSRDRPVIAAASSTLLGADRQSAALAAEQIRAG